MILARKNLLHTIQLALAFLKASLKDLTLKDHVINDHFSIASLNSLKLKLFVGMVVFACLLYKKHIIERMFLIYF